MQWIGKIRQAMLAGDVLATSPIGLFPEPVVPAEAACSGTATSNRSIATGKSSYDDSGPQHQAL
jgi:hypothetical protein